jgi:hypothetical protein
MMPRRPGRLPPRKTVALFVAVAAVSVIALVWMGVRLLTQERALEAQRLQERREAAADRVVAALEQVLLAEERRLANPRAPDLAAGDDLLLFVAGPTGIKTSPEKAILFTRDAGAGTRRLSCSPAPSASSSSSVTTRVPLQLFGR